MLRETGTKFPQGGDGVVLLVGRPLAIGEQDHRATSGGGALIAIDNCLISSEILSLRQRGSGGFLAAGLDAAVDHGCDRTDHQQDGEGGDSFLIPIEKRLKGIRRLGNFGKRDGGFFEISGHDGEIRRAAGADQSHRRVEINAEVWKFSDFGRSGAVSEEMSGFFMVSAGLGD